VCARDSSGGSAPSYAGCVGGPQRFWEGGGGRGSEDSPGRANMPAELRRLGLQVNRFRGEWQWRMGSVLDWRGGRGGGLRCGVCGNIDSAGAGFVVGGARMEF
jgi:hypothetical protein